MKNFLSPLLSLCLLSPCLFVSALTWTSSVFAGELYSQISTDQQAGPEYTSYRNFLIGLGFKDYCQQMQVSLDTPGITPVAKKVLLYNMQEYQIVNVAREVASLAFSFNQSAPILEDKQRLLTKLSTFLLLPFRDFTPKEIDAYVTKNKIPHDKSYEILMHGKMLQEKKVILAAIIELNDIHDDQMIAKLDAYLTRYIQIKYTDLNLRQTNYLGRAIVASFVRLIRTNGFASDEKQLRADLLAHKVFLDNYISDRLTFVNNKGQLQSVTVSSGDFANEYSKGAESYYISIGTAPKSLRNHKLAKNSNLLGNSFKIALYPSPFAESDLVEKVQAGKPLTTMEKIQYAMIQDKGSVAGYSHVGTVSVTEDAATGIKMSWIWDVYPNDDIGGMRIVGAEGFAFAGEFKKIGFVHYDPVKFLNYYKQTMRTRGYMPRVWESIGAAIDTNGHVMPGDKNEKYYWQTKISEREAMSYLNVSDANAADWFKRAIAAKVVSVLESYMTGPDAIAFADGFHNVRGAAYCSETAVLAYLQGADIDPEVDQDRWSAAVHLGQLAKLSYLEDMDFSGRIVSPSGFAWQKQLLAWHMPIMLQQTIDPKDNDSETSLIEAQLGQPLQNLLGRVAIAGFDGVDASDQDAE